MSGSSSEIRDGMRIDWEVGIEMDDGLILCADIYRPTGEGRFPAIVSYGPYGKYLAFQDGYKDQWDRMAEIQPDVVAGSTNKYQNWEVADPEKWVPEGYVIVRVDSRGAGRSPGYIDLWSARETKDFHDCIEWAAAQPWCSGKIGLSGISYYAMNQWQVAASQPPHLAAICVWEGAADFYRDLSHHGGIVNTFCKNWYDMQVKTVQHGVGERGYRSRIVSEWVAGPETLTDEELGANRADFGEDVISNPLDTADYWQSRMPDWSKVTAPLLSAGNWGGQGIHPRGNAEGFLRAASKEKWFEMHGIEHWTHFYTDYGVNLQKKFFGHFLKGEDTGWGDQPRVQLQVRHIDKFALRHESEWPLARTEWTKFYLDPAGHALTGKPVSADGSVSYGGFSDGVTFLTPPLDSETEITGPSAATCFSSCASSRPT